MALSIYGRLLTTGKERQMPNALTKDSIDAFYKALYIPDVPFPRQIISGTTSLSAVSIDKPLTKDSNPKHTCDFGVSHLLLQLKDTVHERLTRRRASRNVNVHGYNPITTSGNTVAIVVIAASVGARTHADYPSWVRHLIVDLPKGGCHFVGECTGHNHNIRLTRRGTEYYTKAILIVTRS